MINIFWQGFIGAIIVLGYLGLLLAGIKYLIYFLDDGRYGVASLIIIFLMLMVASACGFMLMVVQ